MVYQSRRDGWISSVYFIVVMLGFFLLIYSILAIINDEGELFISIFNGVIGIIVSFLMIFIYLNTFYILKNRSLFVRSGPFTDDIRYATIEKIERKTAFGLGAALAKDRFLVYCGKKKNGRPLIVSISPKKPDEFLKKLQKYAPHIVYQEK